MSSEPAPIFFVGAPRSGTTVTFEQFSSHPDLAWLSNYARVLPRLHAINLLRRLLDNRYVKLSGKKNQFDDVAWFNRALPRPDEAYRFWNKLARPGFDRDFLLGQVATAKERKRLQVAFAKARFYQGRERITTKLTGPGRIAYLNSVWPDMFVVHVIRDGVSVVRSLLNVDFWQELGGYDRLWWQGGVDPEEFERWEQAGREPGALAALQWRRIVETTRQEARELLGERYIEVRYEDFIQAPEQHLIEIFERVGLATDRPRAEPLQPRNLSYNDSWEVDYQRALVSWMRPLYDELGYSVP